MKVLLTLLALLASATALSACGSQEISLAKTNPDYTGAVMFREHCSGCHTLAVVGAQGSATSIQNRLKTNGPNFNIRKETDEPRCSTRSATAASPARSCPRTSSSANRRRRSRSSSPQYSGLQAQKVPTTNITLSTK